MKFHTTKKAVKNGYVNVISIGYCNLQYLLYYKDPIAYTTRADGWGANIYDFGNTAIATGYDPFGNIKPKYETVSKYNDTAQTIVYNSNLSLVTKKHKLEKLIQKFIWEVAGR